MAEKKKIKNIKDGTNGEVPTITVVDINPPRSGGAAAPDEVFEHAGYKALCFNVGDILNTESIIVGGAEVIVNARRIQRGTIITVADSKSGTIEENKSKKVINFYQPHVKAIGLTAGTEVKYDLVMGATGKEVAVNVQVQAGE